MVEDLWRRMNSGGYWVPWQTRLLHFNGGLFADPKALMLSLDRLDKCGFVATIMRCSLELHPFLSPPVLPDPPVPGGDDKRAPFVG